MCRAHCHPPGLGTACRDATIDNNAGTLGAPCWDSGRRGTKPHTPSHPHRLSAGTATWSSVRSPTRPGPAGQANSWRSQGAAPPAYRKRRKLADLRSSFMLCPTRGGRRLLLRHMHSATETCEGQHRPSRPRESVAHFDQGPQPTSAEVPGGDRGRRSDGSTAQLLRQRSTQPAAKRFRRDPLALPLGLWLLLISTTRARHRQHLEAECCAACRGN